MIQYQARRVAEIEAERALCGQKLDLCRQRVQQDTLRHRGRSGDPLYGVRRALCTRDGLLTERQWARIVAVFAVDATPRSR
jgi:transposase